MLSIQRTIILEFPNLIPPVWGMLAPTVLTVGVTTTASGYRQRHPTFVHSNTFLARYPAAPCRPKPNPTFLSPPFQVAATFPSVNIGKGGFFCTFSQLWSNLIFSHVHKTPHLGEIAQTVAYFIATTSSTEH